MPLSPASYQKLPTRNTILKVVIVEKKILTTPLNIRTLRKKPSSKTWVRRILIIIIAMEIMLGITNSVEVASCSSVFGNP